MPELPEVETIVRGLRPHLRNLEISRVQVLKAKSVQGLENSFPAALQSRRILGLERRGKFIVLRLSGGAVLVIHLRMTGRLRFMPASVPPEKHTHVIFSFRDSPDQLRFSDQRQFGRLWVEKVHRGQIAPLAHLGPEPLQITGEQFVSRVGASRRGIKALLLDQRFLAGVGNIYADEALHRAWIHPRRRSDSLERGALLRLHRALGEVLRASIRQGGTSVRTFVDSAGARGRFQMLLRVYGREGKPCLDCGATIRRKRVAGRGSHFCPRCQPLTEIP